MATLRGAGTEIIRTAMFDDLDSSQELIIGEAHHIYTVLSLIINCRGLATATNNFYLQLIGWDSHGGASGATMEILRENMTVNTTFVWNDKFSFTGTQKATGLTGNLASTTYQDEISDQGTATAQKLRLDVDAVGDSFDVFITYIDQNNA